MGKKGAPCSGDVGYSFVVKISNLPPESRALIGHLDGAEAQPGIFTIWHVTIHGQGGQVQQRTVRLAMNPTGERSVYLERTGREIEKATPPTRTPQIDQGQVATILNGQATEILHRELVHTGALPEGASYSARLLACIIQC